MTTVNTRCTITVPPNPSPCYFSFSFSFSGSLVADVTTRSQWHCWYRDYTWVILSKGSPYLDQAVEIAPSVGWKMQTNIYFCILLVCTYNGIKLYALQIAYLHLHCTLDYYGWKQKVLYFTVSLGDITILSNIAILIWKRFRYRMDLVLIEISIYRDIISR